MTNSERQAAFQQRRREAVVALMLAEAEVEALRARVEVLQRERDCFEALVGYALKQEDWADVRRRASEVERSSRPHGHEQELVTAQPAPATR